MTFADMSKLSEDERISFIGRIVTEKRLSTWCLTDDETDKPERYRRKLRERFPSLICGEEIRRNFPAKGCAGFTVHPPADSAN